MISTPKWGAALALLFGAQAYLPPAWAVPKPISVSRARKQMDVLDASIGSMKVDLAAVGRGYSAPLNDQNDPRLQRRLREAEVQALLEDHYRAAIVLYDVVDRPELKGDPQYNQALFLLAESLRKSGYQRLSRRYYEELVGRERGPRLNKIVLGILEVASITGDFSGVEAHVARLKTGNTVSDAVVDFVFGKALFRGAGDNKERITRALAQFRSVPRGFSVSAPAAYYSGVTLVRRGQYLDAIKEFKRALTLASSFKDSKAIEELSYLSLGRLYQELGNVSQALDAYQGVSKDSPHFPDMLYEVAWVHVTSAKVANSEEEAVRQYKRALDALELLTAAAPDSQLYPEARVLQGNLQIRLEAPETAYDTFQTVVDGFGEAQTELTSLLASRKDARTFFDELVAADLNNLAEPRLLPKLVVQFALDDPKISGAVDIRRELASTKTDIEQSRMLVRTLEAALNSEQRFSMFPGLRSARLRALSVINRILSAERQLLELEERVVVEYLDTPGIARLEAARLRERDVDEDVEALPTTDRDILAARDELSEVYRSVAHRAFQQLAQVRSMQAQLVAVRLWMRRQNIELPPDKQTLTDKRIEAAERELTSLAKSLVGVQNKVDQAALLSSGDGGWARAKRLRMALKGRVSTQSEVLSAYRARLPSNRRGVVARIDQQRGALRQLERELLQLEDTLERAVDNEVDKVRQKVIDELRKVETHGDEYQKLAHTSDKLLGPVAAQTVESVGEEFRNLVLKADVGILDVAWARKRAHTDQVTDLVRELRRRSNELEEEFDEVLKDN